MPSNDLEAISRIEYAELSQEALEEQRRASEQTRVNAQILLRQWEYETDQPEDLLPDVRVPAPPCPGFDRLDAIMSLQVESPRPDMKSLVYWDY